MADTAAATLSDQRLCSDVATLYLATTHSARATPCQLWLTFIICSSELSLVHSVRRHDGSVAVVQDEKQICMGNVGPDVRMRNASISYFSHLLFMTWIKMIRDNTRTLGATCQLVTSNIHSSKTHRICESDEALLGTETLLASLSIAGVAWSTAFPRRPAQLTFHMQIHPGLSLPAEHCWSNPCAPLRECPLPRYIFTHSGSFRVYLRPDFFPKPLTFGCAHSCHLLVRATDNVLFLLSVSSGRTSSGPLVLKCDASAQFYPDFDVTRCAVPYSVPLCMHIFTPIWQNRGTSWIQHYTGSVAVFCTYT
ncbi:hypothetical protein BC835DRAFT_1334713 [Cytidiella melzeri]|nr:hypothetical protein BC835DRAFT_1334713 [Cytidiella melzeri]